MIRRLQSIAIWNEHYRVHNAQMENYYTSPTARAIKRREARREFDDLLSRISTRL